MKQIIEILGGALILLYISFDPSILFKERLSREHRSFLAFLNAVEDHIAEFKHKRARVGRPRYDDLAALRTFLAKALYRIHENNVLGQPC